MFYPDKKPHISPSALAAWHNAKGLFVRSYFVGEKTPETPAMKAGRKIHALIEGNMLTVVHRFEQHEKELVHMLTARNADDTADIEYKTLGIPDSFGLRPIEGTSFEQGVFVDYKSGKENGWDNERVATDLKMKMTAWLVWKTLGCPVNVKGYVEYIPTQWNPVAKEIEPTYEPSVVAGEVVYTDKELEEFTAFILKTIDEVNEGYEEWLKSTDEFVNQEDIAEYAQLDGEVREREARMALILERIGDQMTMGGKESIPTVFGSFYYTAKKKYEPIPDTWAVRVDENYTTNYGAAEKIIAAASAAKKNFEQTHDPISVTKALAFRAKKSK